MDSEDDKELQPPGKKARSGKSTRTTSPEALKSKSRTVRLLIDELSEVKKWNLILNSPLREGVTIVIPPTELVSLKFEVSLEPLILRMRQGEIYLVMLQRKVLRETAETAER